MGNREKEIAKLNDYLSNQLKFYNTLPKDDPYKLSLKKHIDEIVHKLIELKK
tara:strand:- start:6031 stop:6186 length:156 start_codon:yes stop_codon:yes gene_type:complete